jgi:hypothetical protein
MYTPNNVGETSMALATTGAITGKVSKAMVTRAWINKVMNKGIQVRQGGLDIEKFSQFGFQNFSSLVLGQMIHHTVLLGPLEACHVRQAMRIQIMQSLLFVPIGEGPQHHKSHHFF